MEVGISGSRMYPVARLEVICTNIIKDFRAPVEPVSKHMTSHIVDETAWMHIVNGVIPIILKLNH